MFVHIALVCSLVYISIKPNYIDSLTLRSQSKGYRRRTHWRHSPNPTPYNISASFPRRRAVTSQMQRGFKGFCRWHNMILREVLSEMCVSVRRAVCLLKHNISRGNSSEGFLVSWTRGMPQDSVFFWTVWVKQRRMLCETTSDVTSDS
jgi:hypothetical protein